MSDKKECDMKKGCCGGSKSASCGGTAAAGDCKKTSCSDKNGDGKAKCAGKGSCSSEKKCDGGEKH
jgi:hypothetical protein